ncbi:hypothetical protein TEPIDINF_001658 [Tepidibacillus infernus]|uniref:Uncharacterized protein n=1 Tax=Tepidibacillus decaturensis TaxID=1413211 RepID=A0A135L599_9BACI|nr:hypothetical protein [Tepidibacillus decaturensis]KXG44168.1 hypothetical protein U473_09265 [Tepidibacillus decaturensis]
MNYRYVSGADNGQFHSMDEGDMLIDGGIWATSKDGGAVGSPYKVYFDIYESVWGSDRYVGVTSVTPDSELGKITNFSGSFGLQAAGEYYIVAYKVNDDGWNLAASGTISTE